MQHRTAEVVSVQSKDGSTPAQQRTWLFQQLFTDQLAIRLFYHFKSANVICPQYGASATGRLNLLPVA